MTSTVYNSLTISDLTLYGQNSVAKAASVTGNISVSGTITGNNITTTNTFRVTDGANTGTIDQVSTELTLSSSGNKVAIASGNTLEFKNDGTSQLSAYTANEIVDDCDLFTSLYNIANPSNPRYALSSTFAINQAMPTTLSISRNIIYAYPVRLVKGQVANGAAFYLSVSGSPSITYALYNTANPGSRLAVTSAATPVSGMNLVAFTSSYTVPTTGIYYVCLYATSVGSSLTSIVTPSNTYLNYNLSTMTTGVLNKAAQTISVAGGFPATLSGLTITISSQISYAIVYTLTA
jgi:hypothetical protein